MLGSTVSQSRGASQETVQSLSFALSSCAALVVALAIFIPGAPSAHRDSAARLPGAINPNRASVASLTRLPGVGPARAGAIVAYRERVSFAHPGAPAFSSAPDLLNVPGMGPATVNGIQMWLAFDP